MKQCWLILLWLLTMQVAIACTIGVASGIATADGRPMIWKVRDNTGKDLNRLVYRDDYPIPFVAIGDSGSTAAWMGVNREGFAILNSVAPDLDSTRTDWENGHLMREALGRCATVEEFMTLLNQTDTEGRLTNANMAVIDATGAAMMFEIAAHEWWVFDTANEPGGIIIRTNFTINGGGASGLSRYNRAKWIVENKPSDTGLTPEYLLQHWLRDISVTPALTLVPPYEGRWTNNLPWGYLDTDFSIASYSSVSAVVITGVDTGESPLLSTMWAMLGYPGAGTILPVFPVGQLPPQFQTSGESSYAGRVLNVRHRLFDDFENRRLLDTYKLLDESGDGIWSRYHPFETALFDEYRTFIDSINHQNPDESQLIEQQNAWMMRAYDTVGQTPLDWPPVARFEASVYAGEAPLTVGFTDTSLHRPTAWNWDFNSDGAGDWYGPNPLRTFTTAGTYVVRLTASNPTGSSYCEIPVVVSEPNPPPPIPRNALSGPNPNPFGPSTSFQLELATEEKVTCQVYNIRGQRVDYMDYGLMEASTHILAWAPGERGNFPSGMYIFRFHAGNFTAVCKGVLLK